MKTSHQSKLRTSATRTHRVLRPSTSQKTAITSSATDWPEPKPLTESQTAAPTAQIDHLFPTALRWAADYAQAVADCIQVSPLLVAPTMLSVASIAATGCCRFVGRAGHQEVPVLWHLTLAPPGERKSSTLNMVKRPLLLDPSAQRGGADRPGVPGYAANSVIANDISRAALYSSAAGHHGRLAILSDEDYVVAAMSKSATDGLDLYLKGWSGETFTKKRNDKVVTVRDPNIVVGLVVQPEVARLAIGDDMLRSRGFPQRFLYTLAPAITDRSYLDSRNVPSRTAVRWETCIQDIAALPRRQGTRTITLNEDALHRYAQLADRLDRERQDMARPLFEREWLAKAHGQALRIAGLLALMRSPDARTITEAEVAAAEAWVDLSLEHLGLVLKSMACGDRVVQQAQRVLRWLEQGSREQASRNEITQALRSAAFDTVEQWKPVFDLLEGNGWLRPVRVKAAGAQGGRPSLVFEINPALMSGVVAA